MKKANFKTLLIDLYNIYNPSYVSRADELSEKYHRIEFDSIKNIFIKYNHKSSKIFDPKIGSDEYIHQLIKEYDSGSRTLEHFLQEKEFIPEEKEFIPEEKEVKKENISIEKIEEIIKKLNDEKYQIPVRIFSTLSSSELDLPNKNIIATLGKGARLIVKDEQNQTVGLEIDDVIYDTVSDENPIIEIILKKA